MNDPIEDALSRMKPAEMPSSLMARLTAARSQVAAQPKAAASAKSAWLNFLNHWVLPASVCAAVAVATVAWLDSGKPPGGGTGLIAGDPKPQPKTGNQPNVSGLPFESEERLVAAREMGIVAPPHQRPFRVMELEWVQADTLQPGTDGSAVRVETTRRQVVPVALEIY